MGMATGMRLQPLRQFFGSLRRTGYTGTIILGVEEGVSPSVLSYFWEQNVTSKIIQYANCTFQPFYKEGSNAMKKALTINPNDFRGLTACAKSYPDVKLNWVKNPLGRDWLSGCPAWTGPVLALMFVMFISSSIRLLMVQMQSKACKYLKNMLAKPLNIGWWDHWLKSAGVSV